jgi:hypothetical protein
MLITTKEIKVSQQFLLDRKHKISWEIINLLHNKKTGSYNLLHG